MVAMATYSSHRLMMGKRKLTIFSFSLWIFVFFYRNVNLVVLYVSYDFCLNW